MLNLSLLIIQPLPNINEIIKNNLSILYTDEKMKKIFPPNTTKTLDRCKKKIFRTFYHLLCFLVKLSKLEILLLVVTNVIFVRIFLYLTLNSNVRLQVEYTISEVNLLVIPMMLFIRSPVLTVMINM